MPPKKPKNKRRIIRRPVKSKTSRVVQPPPNEAVSFGSLVDKILAKKCPIDRMRIRLAIEDLLRA